MESEAQAAAGLAARMEDKTLDAAPIWSDLSTFDGRQYRGVADCLVSSDPCQPNSVAGAGRGADDDRFLIDQLIRVADEMRPSRVFRENVTGNADGQLATLVPSLEAMGYSVAAGIFSAAEVGASHRRERLFIMADANGGHASGRSKELCRSQKKERLSKRDNNRLSGNTGGLHKSSGQERELADDTGAGLERSSGQVQKGRGDRSPSSGRNMADAMPAELQGQQSGQHQSAGWEVKNGFAPLQGRARLPYFAPGPSDPRWGDIIQQSPSLKPALRTMAYGVSNRTDELRAAGNGVCPMAAAIAWLSLAAHFE